MDANIEQFKVDLVQQDKDTLAEETKKRKSELYAKLASDSEAAEK